MNGLSDNSDLSEFSGKDLIQVAIGQNEVILHFHPRISLSLFCDVEYLDSGELLSLSEPKEIGTRAVELLGAVVLAATVGVAGSLVLQFDSGVTLTAENTWPSYESFVIQFGEKYIVG